VGSWYPGDALKILTPGETDNRSVRRIFACHPRDANQNTHILWTERSAAQTVSRILPPTMTKPKHSLPVNEQGSTMSWSAGSYPTTPKSNTHQLWAQQRRTTGLSAGSCTHDAQIKHSRPVNRATSTTGRSAGSCHPRCPNQTLTSCGQSTTHDRPSAGLATHDAQIKHSRPVNRATTHDSRSAGSCHPRTPKSNTHELWANNDARQAGSAGSCHHDAPNHNTHSL